MIEDEYGPRSVADDIECQDARPMPREVNVTELVIVAIVVIVVAVLIC